MHSFPQPGSLSVDKAIRLRSFPQPGSVSHPMSRQSNHVTLPQPGSMSHPTSAQSNHVTLPQPGSVSLYKAIMLCTQ